MNSNPAQEEGFLSGTSSTYVDSQYYAWSADPSSVHSSWASYFESGAFDMPPALGGEHYAAGTIMTGEEMLWDVLVPVAISFASAAYFERRDIAWYGGLSAERRARSWIYGEKSKKYQ